MRFYTILICFIFYSFSLFSQDNIIVSPFVVVDGETVFVSKIPQLDIIDFKDINERKWFYKLKRRVLKVYPYALETKLKVDSLNQSLDSIGKKRKKRKYTRSVAKVVKAQYSTALKNLSMKEGGILIKLIYKETGLSTYDLLRNYKGWWSATMWQTFAKMYNHNLKTVYDPINNREDMFIDRILFQAKKEGSIRSL
jgi:hypothetical protein|tara:strand:+ start:1748 stop:2335 length:588 start_codon:yes stop_codon:yes gene_type:complete